MNAIEQTEAGRFSGGKIAALIGCGCLFLILAVVAVVGLIVWGASKVMKSAEPYKASIEAVQGNAAAIEALGSSIEPGFMPRGSFNFNNGEGSVDFSIPVSGPKGRGTIRVVGVKPSGAPVWNYSTFELRVEGGSSIPLGQ